MGDEYAETAQEQDEQEPKSEKKKQRRRTCELLTWQSSVFSLSLCLDSGGEEFSLS